MTRSREERIGIDNDYNLGERPYMSLDPLQCKGLIHCRMGSTVLQSALLDELRKTYEVRHLGRRALSLLFHSRSLCSSSDGFCRSQNNLTEESEAVEDCDCYDLVMAISYDILASCGGNHVRVNTRKAR